MADVLFIIDKSGSIRHERYSEVLEFICNIVEDFEIWQDKVRVAALTFDDDAQLEFYLNTYDNKADIQEAIRSIKYGGKRSNIASAVQMAREQIFRSDKGDRQSAPNNVVLFTDGGANIREEETIGITWLKQYWLDISTLEIVIRYMQFDKKIAVCVIYLQLMQISTYFVVEAIKARIADMHITAVAVGQDLNMMELRGLISWPLEKNIITVNSFNVINSMVPQIVVSKCDCKSHFSSELTHNELTYVYEAWMFKDEWKSIYAVIVCFFAAVNECLSNPCQNGATCLNKVNMYECVCHPDRTGKNCERSKLT